MLAALLRSVAVDHCALRRLPRALFTVAPADAVTWTSPAPTLIICITEPTGKLSLASDGTVITEVPADAVISRVAYLWVVELSVTLDDTDKYSSGKNVFAGRVTLADETNPTLPETVAPLIEALDIGLLKVNTSLDVN